MDRAQHYNEAMRLLVAARISQDSLSEDEIGGLSADVIEARLKFIETTLATAQVHATLCVATSRYDALPLRHDIDVPRLIEVGEVG
jgi:hypothetical protein